MNGLSFKSGYETAWDDVSNENLVPELVHAARALEMEYFHKLGVYEKVSRENQMATGGKSLASDGSTLTKGTPLMLTIGHGLLEGSSMLGVMMRFMRQLRHLKPSDSSLVTRQPIRRVDRGAC